MRRLSLFLVLLWAIVALGFTSVAWATGSGVEEVRLSIPSMHCELCPLTVRRSLENLPGVLRVRASLSSKTATVWIQKEKVKIGDLEKATGNAGYPSSLLSVRALTNSKEKPAGI